MECLFWSVALFILVGAVFYARLSRPLGTGVLAAGLVLFTIGYQAPITQVILWFLFLAVAALINIPAMRKPWLSGPAFALFRKVTPSMSATEREALEAGTVWWDGDLFSGAPSWKKFLNIPKPELSAEEKAFLEGPVEEVCRMIDDWEITSRHRDLPPKVWEYLKREKFFGMIIPKEYGGLGFSALAHSAVVVKVASRSIAAGVTVMVPNSLGPAELLMSYGTDEQKKKYLPSLATGEDIPCFALTAPEAGSDAASMPDRGVVCKRTFFGEETLGVALTFDKRYITLAPVSTLIGLAFRLFDPDHLLGEKEDCGITVALIPSSTEGVEIGRRHDPLSIAFLNGTVKGEDVFIPLDWIVGGRDYVGRGWKMLMERLAIGRSISLPALCAAGAKHASRATGGYARVRHQFKLPVGRFEGVAEKLGFISGSCYLIDAARTMTVGAVDLEERPAVLSATVKYNLTERLRQVINDAMDIHAGSGISLGPKNVMGLVYKSLPIAITVEGANILTRSLIVFGQGAIRCHPYVLAEMMAVAEENEEKAIELFDEALFGHIGFVFSNIFRSFFLGLTGSYIVTTPGGPGRRYYKGISRLSAAFALMTDIAMATLGGTLKRKEMISARLADAFSHLYLASAALKKFEDDGRPVEDIPLVRWSCEKSLHGAQESLLGVAQNLTPIAALNALIKFILFPLGRAYPGPSDRMTLKVAELLLTPSDARERLTDGIYKSQDPNDPTGVIEDAFLAAVAAEEAEKKLKEAMKSGDITQREETAQRTEAVEKGILTREEADTIATALEKRRVVIAVDDFPLDFGKGGF